MFHFTRFLPQWRRLLLSLLLVLPGLALAAKVYGHPVTVVTDTGLEVNQLGSLGGLVKAGFGISIVPQFALQLCQREGVAAVRLNVPHASRPIYAVRRRGRSLSVAAQAFWEMLTVGEPAGRHGTRRK